ncbi:MAG: hypothetical protein GY941_26050 [Planctomycetes bacterium]|nr:hypothetical protein [Planctomycetota bacterium]
MDDNLKKQYLLSEAEYTRKTFEDSAKWIENLERYSLLVTGGIWTWVASNLNNPNFQTSYIIWLPLFVQSMFGFRAWCIYKDMVSMIDYLKIVETTLELPNNLGWATYWDKKRSRPRVVSSYLFWCILHCITAIVAFLVAF